MCSNNKANKAVCCQLDLTGTFASTSLELQKVLQLVVWAMASVQDLNRCREVHQACAVHRRSEKQAVFCCSNNPCFILLPQCSACLELSPVIGQVTGASDRHTVVNARQTERTQQQCYVLCDGKTKTQGSHLIDRGSPVRLCFGISLLTKAYDGQIAG